jgi:hypothetical protein
MGQQQILFLILGACIIGIAASVGVITLQDNSMPDSRVLITNELQMLAAEAQEYFRREVRDGGGQGSFLALTTTPYAIRKLQKEAQPAYGVYSVKRTGTASYLEIIGVGVEKGHDRRQPVRVAIAVWPESTAVRVLN